MSQEGQGKWGGMNSLSPHLSWQPVRRAHLELMGWASGIEMGIRRIWGKVTHGYCSGQQWGPHSSLLCCWHFLIVFKPSTDPRVQTKRECFIWWRGVLSLCTLAMEAGCLLRHRSLTRPLLPGKPAFHWHRRYCWGRLFTKQPFSCACPPPEHSPWPKWRGPAEGSSPTAICYCPLRHLRRLCHSSPFAALVSLQANLLVRKE